MCFPVWEHVCVNMVVLGLVCSFRFEHEIVVGSGRGCIGIVLDLVGSGEIIVRRLKSCVLGSERVGVRICCCWVWVRVILKWRGRGSVDAGVCVLLWRCLRYSCLCDWVLECCLVVGKVVVTWVPLWL